MICKIYALHRIDEYLRTSHAYACFQPLPRIRKSKLKNNKEPTNGQTDMLTFSQLEDMAGIVIKLAYLFVH